MRDQTSIHDMLWGSTVTFLFMESIRKCHLIRARQSTIKLSTIGAPHPCRWCWWETSRTSITFGIYDHCNTVIYLARCRQVHSDVAAAVAQNWNCSFVECSAKDNVNIELVFQKLMQEIEKASPEPQQDKSCSLL